MEVLDALEQKVTALLTEVAVLRNRNAELATAMGAQATTGDESRKIAELEEALEAEQKLRQAALQRVSNLLRRFEEQKSAS